MRGKLTGLIARMHESFCYWATAAWRRDPPVLARDDLPYEPTEAEIEYLMRVAEGRQTAPRHPASPAKAILDNLEREGFVILRRQASGALNYELTEAGHAAMAYLVTPATGLKVAMERVAARWQANFNAAAPRLAEYFATAMKDRSDANLRAILQDAGFSVKFQLTPAMRDVLDATIQQQVELIRSIPAQYLTQVQGAVLRSVQAGRDLGALSKELQDQFGVTKRRAALIARSQNNLATATMTAARQKELGITQAIWQHSGGGKEPRPTHVANSGKPYDIATGWYDPAEKRFLYPGQAINCRCVSRSIIPGLRA
jgi:SPP1 gp7 family putative phage head morphogenesis protein